jgi:hypothetical protein
MGDNKAVTLGPPNKAASHVVAIAVVLLLGSLALLAAIAAEVVSAVDFRRGSGQPLTALLNPRVELLGMLPALCCVFGLVAGLGLVWLREWARRVTLYLATVPVTFDSLLVLFRPAFLFPPDVHGAMLTIGDFGYAVCVYSLVVLTPLSAWWLIVLTRARVRAQFR